jgi:hypothetical protein
MTPHPNEAREREAFEAWFGSTRHSKGVEYRTIMFDRRPDDGTYVEDHTQRHWWTWQNAARASLEATSSAPIVECRAVASHASEVALKWNRANFDGPAFYSALARAVESRDMTWKLLSDETGVSQTTLCRMKDGRCPDAASLAALSGWAGINPANYVVDATQPAGDATARTESAPATAEPAQRPVPDLKPETEAMLGKLTAANGFTVEAASRMYPAAQAQRLTDDELVDRYFEARKGWVLNPGACFLDGLAAGRAIEAEARAPISDALGKLREALEQHDTSRRLYGVHGGCEAEVFAAARALLSGRAGASASQRDSLVEAPKP